MAEHIGQPGNTISSRAQEAVGALGAIFSQRVECFCAGC